MSGESRLGGVAIARQLLETLHVLRDVSRPKPTRTPTLFDKVQGSLRVEIPHSVSLRVGSRLVALSRSMSPSGRLTETTAQAKNPTAVPTNAPIINAISVVILLSNTELPLKLYY
jgi:hypothetical protein